MRNLCKITEVNQLCTIRHTLEFCQNAVADFKGSIGLCAPPFFFQ